MARALTATELTHLRKDGQKCKLYLAVHSPATVFTAQVNGAPSDDDEVYEINYDGGSAGYTDALPGMTVYVGTEAGAYDKGQVRLRTALPGTSGKMEIGEESDINWADNDHLTVVDEFSIWTRHIYIDGDGNIFMDRDVSYSDQHASKDPVPVLGPPAVAWLSGGSAQIGFDAGDSFCLGSSISTYAWAASGGSWDDASLAAPTLTVTAAGTYRVSCTVTAANGKSLTGYRYVFVFDANSPPTQSFALDGCSGSWQSGGWSFKVTMYDEALRTEIRDRAMVTLFARDWYGSDEVSIGPVAGRENVVAVGWIAGETIKWDPEQGEVAFEVQGPQWWINRVTGFPVGVEDHDGAPTEWTEMDNLTIDKGLWHLLHWRSTVTLMMDVRLTGDTRQVGAFEDAAGTLWQQTKNAAGRAILAQPCCDRYGRLFVQIDSQLMPTGDRSSIPTVHALEKQDWIPPIDVQRNVVNKVAQVDLSGVAYADGEGQALFSLAPGHIFGRWGDSVDMRDHLALSSQSQANTLAGLIFGKQNNPYPQIPISLASNHRMLDVCPHQYAEIDIAAEDTQRGIVETDLKLVPRRVSFDHDPEAGMLLTRAEFEGYTDQSTSCNGDPPAEPPDMPAPPTPPPPWIPPLPSAPAEKVLVTGIGLGIWYTPDGGMSWGDASGAHSGETGYDAKVSRATLGNPRDSVVCWWAANDTIYYSPDGGQSWTEKPIGGSADVVRAIGLASTDPNVCYVLARNTANDRVWVYRTGDAGGTWTSVEIVPPSGNYSIDTDNWTDLVSVSANDTYVYVSVLDDGSSAIVRLDADLSNPTVVWGPEGGPHLGVKCDPLSDGTVWAFGDMHSHRVEKSIDNGGSWVDRGPIGAWNIYVLLISETDGDDVVVYDNYDQDLYVTRDGGHSWTRDAAALPFAAFAGARGNNDESVLWVGRNATSTTHLQRSEDTGSIWEERSSGFSPSDAEITAIAVIWA